MTDWNNVTALNIALIGALLICLLAIGILIFDLVRAHRERREVERELARAVGLERRR